MFLHQAVESIAYFRNLLFQRENAEMELTMIREAKQMRTTLIATQILQSGRVMIPAGPRRTEITTHPVADPEVPI